MVPVLKLKKYGICRQNGAEQIPSQHSQHDLLDSFQSLRLTSSSQQNTSHRDLLDTFQSLRLTSTSQQKASHAMRSLQGYYGLKPENKAASDGLEMSIYRQGESRQSEDNPSRTSPALKHPLGLRQKSRSLANGLASHNSEPSDSIRVPLLGEYEPDKWNDEPTTPEMLLKDENNPVSGFSATRGKKGIALRPKAANRTASPAGNEGGFVVNPIPSGLSDSLSADRLSGVRKSSSTPSLNDDGHSSATSIWNLKPDLQALSSVAIPKPIFDSRRRKAALD